LVLLVVLSILGYTLTSRLAARRHRDRYMIDYSIARYACDSAAKYALTRMGQIQAKLVDRSNEPDFSDLFLLSEVEYKEFLAGWAAQIALEKAESSDETGSDVVGDVNDAGRLADPNDPNSLTVRGPYGPAWPLVTKPDEFEIGSANIRIEIEDENAKYPLSWALLSDEKVRREAQAGLETFCEWMGFEIEQIDSLKMQMKEINKIKPYKLEFKPVTTIEKKAAPTGAKTGRGRASRSRTRSRSTSRSRTQVKTTTKKIPASVHAADFAKLFQSSIIDTEALARPTGISEGRNESALKYMGLWASKIVNINTAPRQVLEAAFTFGGDYKEIAEEIIQRRRTKTFKDIEELKKVLFKYSDSIEKCEKYITTASTFFTIKVTAVSGMARASVVIAITKEGLKVERVAAISS
jgi:hypothetical protein